MSFYDQHLTFGSHEYRRNDDGTWIYSTTIDSCSFPYPAYELGYSKLAASYL